MVQSDFPPSALLVGESASAPFISPRPPGLSLPLPPSSELSTQQLLDKVAWHAVEEEAQHDEQQQDQHDLDDQPLVAVAHKVADGFQRAQEPQEGSVWATGWGRWRFYRWKVRTF